MFSVLIVEDNLMFRNALRDVLSATFPTVGIEEATNGREALSKIKKSEPSLVFMDIKLPDLNGLELTKTIKASRSDAEVVILSSHNFPEYRHAALLSGASRFLAKGSVGVDDITAVVQSSLNSRERTFPGTALG